MRLIAFAFCAAIAASSALPAGARAAEITVFAAASMRDALAEAGARWRAETGHAVRIAPAGSSALARQIAQGAPADLFVSANPGWMDWLEDAGLLQAGSRRIVAANRLVLIVPDVADAAGTVSLEVGALLGALGADGRMALAFTDAVPAGIYARQALEALGLWQALSPRIVETDNVRAALALLALGAARLGIVYASDAAAEPRVGIAADIPAKAHDPILYPAAVMRNASAPEEAASFLGWLAGAEAQAIFAAHGFAAPPE